MENGGKLVWFLAGASIGATIALLVAPQSGRETRRIIKRKTREGREVLSDTSRDLMEKGRDLYEKGLRVADDAAEMIERGRRLVEG
ncbi:MAG TPA: YtxH domain-containing protein [Bryobacteraceae bacterium]|nr:YtxH domain-containing protein [Bryobacteraceae bacterium]